MVLNAHTCRANFKSVIRAQSHLDWDKCTIHKVYFHRHNRWVQTQSLRCGRTSTNWNWAKSPGGALRPCYLPAGTSVTYPMGLTGPNITPVILMNLLVQIKLACMVSASVLGLGWQNDHEGNHGLMHAYLFLELLTSVWWI